MVAVAYVVDVMKLAEKITRGVCSMLKSIQEVLKYGFSVLNRVYFNNELPPIVITIMSSLKPMDIFVWKNWRAEEGHYNEINISAEHLHNSVCIKMVTLYGPVGRWWWFLI